MDVFHAVSRWREVLASEYARTTVKARAEAVLAIFNRAGVTQVDALTEDQVREHFRDLKPWTRRAYLTSLRQFFAWLGGPDPTAGIRKPKMPPSRPNPISEAQLVTLLAATSGRLRLAVLLGAYAGLRAREASQVHAHDVLEDLDGRLQLRIYGKGDKFDLVPLPPVLAAAVRAALVETPDGYLFATRSATGYITPRNLSTEVKQAAAAVGVPMRYHQLRHRFGTAVYRARRDLLLTQKAMRHGSPQTTAGYAQVADEDRYAVALELPGATLEEGSTDEPDREPQRA